MSEWKTYRLGEHLEVLSGFAFNSVRFTNDGGMPLIRIRDLVNAHTDVNYSGPYSRVFVIENGDVLIGMDGDFHVVRWKGGKALLNQRVLKVSERAQSELDLFFSFHVLGPLMERVNNVTAATTVKHLSTKDVINAIIQAPSKDTQRTIARILGTIDDLIEQTEALIEKQRHIKQGMLHDLFTRGVGANGQLRPPQQEAPELYKETKLGWAPKDWEDKTLNEVKQFITSGSRGWAAYYADEGALFIRIGNLSRDHINFRWEDVQYVVPPMGSEGSRTAVEAGDLLISITADLGITAVVPAGIGEAYVNQHIALVRLDPSATNPRWVGMYLAAENGVKQFQRMNDSGTKAGLNLPTVGALCFANPPRDERDHIVGLIDAQDALVAEETANLNKLLSMKAGLMQDLLTGRVPVDHLVETMIEQVATVANPS